MKNKITSLSLIVAAVFLMAIPATSIAQYHRQDCMYARHGVVDQRQYQRVITTRTTRYTTHHHYQTVNMPYYVYSYQEVWPQHHYIVPSRSRSVIYYDHTRYRSRRYSSFSIGVSVGGLL